MIGSTDARPSARTARACAGDPQAARAAAAFPSKLLSLLMAVVLAVSLVPSAAWAQADESESMPKESADGPSGTPASEEGGAPGALFDQTPGVERNELPAADGSSSGSDPAPAGDLASAGELSPTPAAAPAPLAAPAPAQLAGVELAKPSSLEVGAVLEAKAYTGSSYAPTYVEEGVTYTWKYADTTSPSYYTEWTTIEGQTGATFTVTDDYRGKCLSVSASAGANVVDFGYPYGYGPFKQAGAVDIYSASLSNGTTTTYAYAVGDTVTVQAKEKGASSPIDPDKLTYQWLVSSDGSTFDQIAGATQASLALDESYAGKQVKCMLAAKVGDSTYPTRATNKIAPAGSVYVTSVKLDKSGKLAVGDTLSATASAATGDVTANPRVAWSWYCGESAYAANDKIEGAEDSTLAVTDALVGKYVEARADGGYGEVDSSAAGPVVKAGSVALYKVEASGNARVGATLTAKAYESASAQVPENAVVDYQWQYAETNTTSDGAFKDIPGATGASFTIGDTIDGSSSLGRYVRVKATSDGSVVSTKKPSYYGSTYVDPLGPVMLDGAYELSSVKLASSGQGMQAGATITPTAQVKDGYYESDAPADAKVTYTWEVRDGEGGAFEPLTEGVAADGSLALSEALVGKQVRVSANALVEGNNPSSAVCTVLAADTYDLLRVTLSPASGDLFTGDVITAKVQARSLANSSYGDDVTDDVEVSWSVGQSEGGPFEPLGDAASARLTIPEAAAGKYLKVTATSGSSSVEAVTASPVTASDSLEGAAKKLEKAGFRANPVYGQDENVNDVVEAALAELGFADVSVTTKAAEPRRTDERATVGVSAEDGEGNGRVTYFFMDPDEASGYVSYTSLRQVEFTFILARDGETYEYRPGYAGTIPWDDAKVTALLERKAAALAIGFAPGDAANAVTADFALPSKVAGASWTEVVWSSSDPAAVDVGGYAWSGYTGAITRTAANQDVTLTATVSAGGIASSGGPDAAVEKTFDVTVKGDPVKVAAAKAELERKVQENFVYENVKISETGAMADHDALTGDVSLPKPAVIGVDGKYYEVKYEASTDAVVANGWAGAVFRPLPGEESAPVDVTLTVTDKANAEITAAKTLAFAVAPLEQAAIDRELAVMDAAAAGYAAALVNGQDAGAVAGDLHAFQKAYFDTDGNLAWAYDYETANAAGSGIVPTDLEGYDPMGSAGWRLFRSSDPAVVAHENLLVTQPEYNTKVTVSSRLASEAYARYAERYPDNADFQKLAGLDVSAAFTVVGTSGQEAPYVTATCSVIGVDKDGATQTWAAAEPYTLETGATAADLTEALFAKTGLAADYDPDGTYGWSLNTITSPFDAGLTLGWDEATGRYWQLFVNGQAALLGASGIVLQPGDSVTWSYSAYGDPAPTDKLSVTCEVVGVDAQGAPQTWASAATFAVEPGATAADLTEALFKRAGLAADYDPDGAYGWSLNTITSPYDGRVLGSVLVEPPFTYAFWQLFVNGEMASKGAGSIVLEAGDTVTWCYGSDGTLPGQISASASVIGVDANGVAQTWAVESTYRLVEGSTAADLFEQMLAQTGLESKRSYSEYGLYVETVTSPFDGRTLGWDEATGKYWQFFVNGVTVEVGASSVVLAPGDHVTWSYSAFGSALPDPDEVVTNPNAPRPSFDASWAGFANGMAGGAVTDRPTPEESAELAWSYEYGAGTPGMAAASEPVLVNGRVFLVVNDQLRMVNAQTGRVEATAPLGSTISFQCRPVYAEGLVVVPADDGTLTAFTADTLACVWKTLPLPAPRSLGYQSLSSLTVNGGRVYAGFTVVGAGGAGKAGTLLCVNLADGTEAWRRTTEADESGGAGYYWAGAAVSGADVVMGDEAGVVSLMDGETGAVLSSVSLGASCRAGVVSVPGSDGAFVAVSSDGVLHRLVRAGDTLILAGSVAFAPKSTSTPALADGKAFVCGADAEGYGTLSVIDLATMAVERTVRGGKGEAQCAPLVSVQASGTFAYFTCNGLPGGVYSYRLGDDAAYALYVPDADHQQYCMSSVVADERGNLYYANDSGTLFALAGKAGVLVTFDVSGGSYVAPRFVGVGSAVARPDDPARAGFTFGGWYADAACATLWDFAAPVTREMTLYAKWTPRGTGGEEGEGGEGETGGSHADEGTRPQPGGTVAPGRKPLVRQAANAADGAAAAGADAASKAPAADKAAFSAGNASGGATAGAGKGAAAADSAVGEGAAAGGMNPLAIGGLALGVVGLAGAALYVLRARKRSIDTGEGKA